MTKEEVVARLQQIPKSQRAAFAREVGLSYSWIRYVQTGVIKNPGTDQMDTLREYFRRADRGRK